MPDGNEVEQVNSFIHFETKWEFSRQYQRDICDAPVFVIGKEFGMDH